MAQGLAIKAFFTVLFRRDAAAAVRQVLSDRSAREHTEADTPPATDTRVPAPVKPAPVATAAAGRSDALSLLSTLQREARFLDLVGESLDGFDDAQVGAAARQVLADVRQSLDRMFAIAPLADQQEGDQLEVPQPAAPARCHIVGRQTAGATRGELVHRGWQATHCRVPTWSGATQDALILSPVEIEIHG